MSRSSTVWPFWKTKQLVRTSGQCVCLCESVWVYVCVRNRKRLRGYLFCNNIQYIRVSILLYYNYNSLNCATQLLVDMVVADGEGGKYGL